MPCWSIAPPGRAPTWPAWSCHDWPTASEPSSVYRFRASPSARRRGAARAPMRSRCAASRGPAVEVGLAKHVRVAQGRTILAIARTEVDRHAAALRGLVEGHQPDAVALVVGRQSLRPLVGRFAARVVPGVAVLSAAEAASLR